MTRHADLNEISSTADRAYNGHLRHWKSPMNPPIWIVLCNCPDSATAEHLAKAVLDRRLAACVNLIDSVRALYRWQGAVAQATECTLLFKTAADRYAALASFLEREHPYEIPEIIAWPLAAGLAAYGAWVEAETREEFPA
jgi:periplasmic divalent cation tolerance protein